MYQTRLKILLATILLSPMGVSATEGALEISSACAAVGCFSGDSSGMPVTINAPGNYVFTSNLSVDNENTTGVSVNADDVVIDMSGFAINGPNECTGQQEDCTAIGAGNGFDSVNRNITIKNGQIRGMGQYGITLRAQAIVENVVAEHNGRSGIVVGTGSTVTSSFVNFNGYFGFQAGGARLVDCSAADNGQLGFAVSRSILVRAVANRSGYAGVQDDHGSQVHDSLFQENQIGLESINGATSIYNSTFYDNSSVGIFARGDTKQDPSGLPVLLGGNMITTNNGGNANAQLGGGGTFLELSTNFCGSDTTCP